MRVLDLGLQCVGKAEWRNMRERERGGKKVGVIVFEKRKRKIKMKYRKIMGFFLFCLSLNHSKDEGQKFFFFKLKIGLIASSFFFFSFDYGKVAIFTLAIRTILSAM